MTGNYTATFIFGGMTYPSLSQVTSTIPLTAAQIASINAYAGDTFTPSTAVSNIHCSATTISAHSLSNAHSLLDTPNRKRELELVYYRIKLAWSAFIPTRFHQRMGV